MNVMKKGHGVSVLLFLGLLLTSLGVGGVAQAADVQSGTGFTYELHYPENQIEETGYFKLRMQPGQAQDLTIALTNQGEEDIVVEVSLQGAKTNSNGVLEYGPTEIENDASLKFPFEELVTGEPTITVPAKSTVDYPLHIQMPETSFDGVVVGGIYLIQADSEDGASGGGGGSMVVNKYAYAIATVLSESDTELAPDLTYNKTYAGQSNYRNTFFVNFSNTVAAYVNNMSVEVQIMKKGSEAVLYETKRTEMRMAPNTYIDFPVSMNGEKMVSGDYTAHILINAGSQSWEWDEEFEVTVEEADKYNERDVGLVQEKGINWQLIAMLVAGVILAAVLVFIGIRFVRNKGKKGKQAKKSPKKGSTKKRKR